MRTYINDVKAHKKYNGAKQPLSIVYSGEDISIIIFSGANVFFDYAIPESIQPIFGLGWIAMVIGLGYGGYVAWGDKLASSEGVE